MNRKQRAVLLIALLCAAWVCSAAFMAAFAWHDCQAAHCPICPVLAQCLDVLFALSLFLPLLCKWASVRILRAQTKRAESAPLSVPLWNKKFCSCVDGVPFSSVKP